MVTSNFEDFGYIELEEVKRLMTAIYEQGFPNGFEQNNVTIAMNQNSGFVFFTNSDYQVAMLDGNNKLSQFYVTPHNGHEGFKEDLQYEYNNGYITNSDDIDFLKQHNII